MITNQQLKVGKTYWFTDANIFVRYTKECMAKKYTDNNVSAFLEYDQYICGHPLDTIFTELPINFNTEGTQSILREEKTQTRRPLKGVDSNWLYFGLNKFGDPVFDNPKNSKKIRIKLPYQADYLWVEEAYSLIDNIDRKVLELAGIKNKHDKYLYKTDLFPQNYNLFKWIHPQQMPREASRIQLYKKKQWVERPHDITDEDAIAEGVKITEPGICESLLLDFLEIEESLFSTHKNSFFTLWDSIYGKTFPSESNPWVSVTEFERIT